MTKLSGSGHAVCLLEKVKKIYGTGNILPFEKSAAYLHFFMKLDNFVPLGRPPSSKGIIQVITEFLVSNN